MNEEIISFLKDNLYKEKTLKSLCDMFKITEFEMFGYIYNLRNLGVNIDYFEKNGEAYLFRNEHPDLSRENVYYIQEDVNKTSKIAVISDIRAGSREEEFAILNDMYLKFLKEGINKVFILGNLIEGKYSKKMYDEFGKSLITNTAYGQANHFIEHFPHIDGIDTFFITGSLDHSFSKELNVGNYIASKRADLKYLGPKSCVVHFNNVIFRMEQLKNAEAYTYAYPPQKYARAMSDDENYDAIFLSGGMNFQHFPKIKNSQIFAIPSVVSRTPKMVNDYKSNTIGAFIFDIEYTKSGKLKRLVPIVSTYESTKNKEVDTKKINIIQNDKGELVEKKENSNNQNMELINKMYNLMHKEEKFEELRDRLEFNDNELYGLINILQHIGKPISISNIDGERIVQKSIIRRNNDEVKPPMEELHKKTFGFVSDTHYGSIYSQPSMVNTFCYEAYNRGITDMFHVGDITDGDYSRVRPIHVHEVFLYGATGQLDYVVKNLPKYPGMKWHAICGSHDQTHLFNYGMDIGKEIAKRRPDFEYLGQDRAYYEQDNLTIELFHPGGGTSRILSTKPQNGLDQNTFKKVDLRATGHYHKVYYMDYNGTHVLLLPCNVATSSFMMKQEIPNLMGNYFVTIYYDDNGHIHYLVPEPMIFSEKDVRINDWENPRKNIKNKILTKKTSNY